MKTFFSTLMVAMLLSLPVHAANAGGGVSYGDPIEFNNGTTCVGLFKLNNRNQAVGNHCNGEDAFIWDNGTIIELSVPNSIATSAITINDRGWVVGTYIPTDNPNTNRGFVWTGRDYIVLDPPGSFWTDALAINNNGHVAGLWFETPDFSVVRGFMWDGKKFVFFDSPEGTTLQHTVNRMFINDSDRILAPVMDNTSSQIEPVIYIPSER
jgi:hypothetical protein